LLHSVEYRLSLLPKTAACMPFSSCRRCNLHAFASVSPGTRTYLWQHTRYMQMHRTPSTRTNSPSTHARKVRYVDTRPGTQTPQRLSPSSSSSSSTCFLLHHHVGQEWAPDPPAVAIITVVIDMFLATSSCLARRAPTALKNGPPRPWSLGPPVLPCTPLGGVRDHTQLLEGGSYKTLLWLRGAAPHWPHT
jgi:hypothetical protein